MKEITLKEYFEKTDQTYEQLGKKIGVHKHSIQRYANWQSEPSVSIAYMIEEATNKKVKAKVFADYWKAFKDAKKKYG